MNFLVEYETEDERFVGDFAEVLGHVDSDHEISEKSIPKFIMKSVFKKLKNVSKFTIISDFKNVKRFKKFLSFPLSYRR